MINLTQEYLESKNGFLSDYYYAIYMTYKLFEELWLEI